MTETAKFYSLFTCYIYRYFIGYVGVRGVVDPTVAYHPKNVGSRPSNCIFIPLLLLLQCEFNIN